MLAAIMLALCLQPRAASASTLTTLHSFCAEQNCADGSTPTAPLAVDAAGNIFGTTSAGGIMDKGVVFALERKTSGRYVYRVIDDLCADTINCSDGGRVTGNLVTDVNGNVYVVASNGGAFGHGVVFELSPTKHGLYKRTALYNFCGEGGDCLASGNAPVGGLTYQGSQTGASYDGQSPLFEIASEGGVENAGVAYQLTFGARKKSPVFSVLYTFCSLASCADGLSPNIGLTPDAGGNLFGATNYGGGNGDGIAFELSPAQNAYELKVLHQFCTTDCSDGSSVIGALMPASGGSFVSTTRQAGANNGGTLFELSQTKSGKWKYSVLRAFCAPSGCPDGSQPGGPVAVDPSGRIFGAMSRGGASDTGTVFSLTGKKYSVLYDFCTQANCTDGEFANGVILNGDGGVLGTTAAGGSHGEGTIFSLEP